MGTTFQPTNGNPTPDLHWYNDVSDVIKRMLGWTGTNLLPIVDSLIIKKDQSKGIKIDIDDPNFGWEDILGMVHTDLEAASHRPAFNVYRAGIKAYQFTVDDRLYFDYHIPHNYAPNTDIFIHTHWSHNSNSVTSGNITWSYELTYAKAHNQAAFHTPITISINIPASNIQYQQILKDVQISGTSNSSLLNTADLEPDGVIICRTFLSNNTISAATNPFMHYNDLHYQSTGIATKQRTPDFYT